MYTCCDHKVNHSAYIVVHAYTYRTRIVLREERRNRAVANHAPHVRVHPPLYNVVHTLQGIIYTTVCSSHHITCSPPTPHITALLLRSPTHSPHHRPTPHITTHSSHHHPAPHITGPLLTLTRVVIMLRTAHGVHHACPHLADS